MRLNIKNENANKQITIYSVDTSAFYNEREQIIADKMLPLYLRRTYIKAEIDKLKTEMGKTKDEDNDEIKNLISLLSKHNSTINKSIEYVKKSELHPTLVENKEVRKLREDAITYPVKDEFNNPTGERRKKSKVVISMFESELTRTLNIESGSFSDSLIIVEQVYKDVSEQLVKNGFTYQNHTYRYYSSSAGQIRKKKLVFIREDLWELHKNTLMCGLSEEYINSKGGSNVNKYLAYMSLQASASVRWKGFNIDKVIICEDLELEVLGEVDYICNKTFDITRQFMPITMMPTDGAGMCLPSVSELSFQFRANWIKGLVSPFNFRQWIMEMRLKHPDKRIGFVRDIYNKEWDIIGDKIEMILCKSMFKMNSFYTSWKQFTDYFKKYKCHAAICQIENEKFGNIKLGYQMIQNLPQTTDEELALIVSKTAADIKMIGRDKETMLRVLGVTPENKNKNYYQQALELMPELLSDTYSKEVIKSAKKSMVKSAKAGKVEISGKYIFAVPDWFAYCEWLIGGVNRCDIKGLLDGEEVYSNSFKDGEKLDVLRSPSLYREHGIRVNKVNKKNKKWLISNGLYIGYKSLLAKILMLDYDGDQLFCVNSPHLVLPAEKQMEGVVPLHYETQKAKIVEINKDNIFDGLQKAFSANIGIISNKISQVWDKETPDLDVLRWLCLTNNETIDFAKTLSKSKLPPHVDKRIKKATKGKLPHLFIYAKDNKKDNVESDNNNSVMNRLAKLIPNPNIHFDNVVKPLDYKMLMKNKDIVVDEKVIELYSKLDLKKWTMSMQANDKEATGDNLPAYANIRNEMLQLGFNINDVVDMLIYYLYVTVDSGYKTTLWSSFGDVIVENIKRNQAIEYETLHNCEDCGDEYIKKKQRQKKCETCMEKIKKEKTALRVRNHRNKM